ncbi:MULTISPECIES: winged helix-turn-helix domain-containing protein [unclassified Microbacterium]|uniref:winged helix-turn-helix domain-containing protein n=1 Tax=unclassified Microbacterium TaxID=2609290 RepID=UPI000EA935B0|nr:MULTISPECIES: crosslink repair DNA glycosylase YcaQ family protein [unclassified Microbacterium]MBT2485258.1 YcaQ family DNA glycosylase [Microbacterium sp. ISL-108]RKN68076.1 winged helix-turn-helix domain-containing protein [Microbacterium sp. CGR2]
MTETLSAAQARRIALAAQGFTRARPAAVTARHVHRVMERLGVLQIDSVNVFARSHYLPLFSRLGVYEPALLDRVFLAGTTHYVEYLAHEATFIPIEDWPLWRFRMDAFRRRLTGEDSWMSSNARTVQWVQDELRVRGPLRPADIRADAPRERGTWWDWDEVKLALEYLWRTGDVAVSGRRGFERTYALAEHVIPEHIRAQQIPRADAIRELIRRAARSSGVATQSDLADYYRIRDRAAVAQSIADLVDIGELHPAQVRGWERGGRPLPAWRHRESVLPRRVAAAAILTPFDPVVWFRDRALRAFDLDYRIEIYVPAAKRRFGYYSLPVLVGDRIVARVDLKADRASSTLRVQSAWWEPQARPDDAAAVATELALAARWQGLEQVSVSGWGDATDALHRELQGNAASSVYRHMHVRESAP